MDVSVVVPTLNGRAQLARCLDALCEHAPGTEVVVVNGPSTDGTTGMVRERADVDVLVEIADRNVNAARNAGISRTTGEWIAFVSDEYSIEPGWFDALRAITAAPMGHEHGSRLGTALPARLVGAGAAVADTTRAIATRSKRLVTRTAARDRHDEIDYNHDPNDVSEAAFGDRTDEFAVVTGPVHRELVGAVTTRSPASNTVAGRDVTYFNPENVAFRRDALRATDGFDEYLQVGGARDLAHRLAAAGYWVTWADGLCVHGEYGADGIGRDPRWDARSRSYLLVKNYGPRPGIARRIAERAARDTLSGTREAIRGDLAPSRWLASARDVTIGGVIGVAHGLRARWRDRDRHNPNGWSSRADRAVRVYDRR